jgi:putative transposase
LLGIARSSLYTEPTPLSTEDLRLHHALDRLYTAHPYCGQRRLKVALAKEGVAVGRDRIRSAMAFLGLETLYPKPNTSVPQPNHRLYPYLLRNITAGYPNHIWGTDITYIPLVEGYCYLVALLDWYSRYVLSWKVSAAMTSDFCIEALHEALAIGEPRFHNNDQGSQFTSDDYLDVLAKHPEVAISMDGRGRCLDNIFTERLWRSVKYENVYLNEYATVEEARSGIGDYLRFYNAERPHQSLGYRTPQEIYCKKIIDA